MKLIDGKQQWEGYFTYCDGYDTAEHYKEIEFVMEIIVNDDAFEGVSTDAESKHAFHQPAKVKGFFQKDMVSFIMKYPCAYYKNENGAVIIDKTSEHPDIHYYGSLDKNDNTYKGHWEIVIHEQKVWDGYIEEVINGEFEIRRMR